MIERIYPNLFLERSLYQNVQKDEKEFIRMLYDEIFIISLLNSETVPITVEKIKKN